MTDKKKKKKDDKMDAENKALVKNTIDVNPTMEEENIGEALSISQRRQRGISMRRNKAKIAQGRRRMAKKPADKKRLTNRATMKARRLVRAKVAGDKGKDYSSLSPSEKSMVDTKVAKRQAVVKRIAKRLLPKMKRADLARIAGKSGPSVKVEETQLDEKRYHEARNKDGTMKFDKRFKIYRDAPKPVSEQVEIGNIEDTLKSLKSDIENQYKMEVSIKKSNLGKEPSYFFSVFGPKNTWKNGIALNSPFSISFHIYDNVIEMSRISYQAKNIKFRKSKFKSEKDLHKKILDYFKKNNEKIFELLGLTEATAAVERMRNTHKQERENMNDDQEREMDRVRTRQMRKKIRTINTNEQVVNSDEELLEWIVAVGENPDLMNINEAFEDLIESIELAEGATKDKILAAVDRGIKKGKDLMDVTFDISRATGVDMTSRQIEKAYISKYGDPRKKAPTDGTRLRKKYGFKESLMSEGSLASFKSPDGTTFNIWDNNKGLGYDIINKTGVNVSASSIYPWGNGHADAKRRMNDVLTAYETSGAKGAHHTLEKLTKQKWMVEAYDPDGYTPAGPAGAGLDGTERLTKRYKKDTPGEVVDKTMRKDVNEDINTRFQNFMLKENAEGKKVIERMSNLVSNRHDKVKGAESLLMKVGGKFRNVDAKTASRIISLYDNQDNSRKREFENQLTDTKGYEDILKLVNEEYLEERAECQLIGMKQIREFEKIVDKLFKKYGIDLNFTKHFADRMSDERNTPCITMRELAEFIKKIYAKQGKSLKGVAGAEAVVRDMQKDLNIPVAVKYDQRNDEFDVVMKTIMRKKNFRSPDRFINYEQVETNEGVLSSIKNAFMAKNDAKSEEKRKDVLTEPDIRKMGTKSKLNSVTYHDEYSSLDRNTQTPSVSMAIEPILFQTKPTERSLAGKRGNLSKYTDPKKRGTYKTSIGYVEGYGKNVRTGKYLIKVDYMPKFDQYKLHITQT